MKVDGGCHCGALTYEAEIDPEKVLICHCTDCQQISGSAFRTVAPTPPDNFRFLTGTPTVYVKVGDSGNKREQTFCPTCGTPIYSKSPDGEPGMLGIRVGTIRQRDRLPPKLECFTRSAHDWALGLSKGRQFEKMPV